MSSQPDKTILKLDWCSYEAAKFAVEHWHYSEVMPAGKAVIVGAWESGQFIGCVVFSRGANNHIGNPYGLKQIECCELTRIALTKHRNSVSRITSLAIRFLKKQSPGLRLIISYSDPEQNHHGGVYQAMNWIYVGTSQPQREKMICGKLVHKRTVFSRNGTAAGGTYSKILWKHKYLMPLDAEIRKRILPLSKPYPKRAQSNTKDAPANHAGEGGSTPTCALQLPTLGT